MNGKIYVWDPLIRLFHWLLVASFTIAWFTGDEESQLHIYSGYTILGLLVFRLLWGLIGSRYARFSSLSLAPAAAFAYLRGLFSRQTGKTYLGHNPAGSWMVIFLLVSLSLTVVSGLKVYGLEGLGPLAGQTDLNSLQLITSARAEDTDDHETNEDRRSGERESEEEHEGEDFWEETHEWFANLTVALIFLHVAGVLLSSRKHGKNLVRAMITGFKSKS